MQDGGGTAPDCPDWLSEPEKLHWVALIEKLQNLGVELDPADADALGIYCRVFIMFRDTPEKVNASMLAQMRMIWEKYGMTNGARQALGLRAKKPVLNPFTAL